MFSAPINDHLFNIVHIARLEDTARMSNFEGIDVDVARATLEGCARLCEAVIAPLNQTGDRCGSTLIDGEVALPPGFQAAYAAFVDGGWQGLQHPPEYGGQGLPKTISAACSEILNAANMSFGLCPLLTDGAIEALLTAGSNDLKSIFLDNLVAGRWTGTMNLTEPQAGSDLSLIRTRAESQADGTYKIHGTKIFITYGDHDLAENIVHLVLARVPGAPAGVKGISLFVVPKFLVADDGSVGQRNDVKCVGVEHKLGVRASPTTILQYGDSGGATGFLVGQENAGLQYMFVMMNAARYAVGVQGIAIAERSYQLAVDHARKRIQGRAVDGSSATSVSIIHHPDVRRMLIRMRALIEGCRSLAAFAAASYDLSHFHDDHDIRKDNLDLYEFLVPLIKGYSTEMSLEVTSLALQVQGGMGFVEETGAAQHYRDARILTIYEGTTGIQANDFVGRKNLRDSGKTARNIAKMIGETEVLLNASGDAHARAISTQLGSALRAFLACVDFIITNAQHRSNDAMVGGVPYLMLAGNLMAGWQMARSFLIAREQIALGRDVDFMSAKAVTAHFYADHILNEVQPLSQSVLLGADSALAMPLASF